MLMTTNFVCIVELDPKVKNYPQESLFNIFSLYRFSNANPSTDGCVTHAGNSTRYIGVYFVKKAKFYRQMMDRYTVTVIQLDLRKYSRMFAMHMSFVQMNYRFEPCFECYNFYEKLKHPHCHPISAPMRIKPFAVTKNDLDFAGSYDNPEFLRDFNQVMIKVNGTIDKIELEDMYSDDLRIQYGHELDLGRNFIRDGCGFTTINGIYTLFLNDLTGKISCTTDFTRGLERKRFFREIHINEVKAHYRPVAQTYIQRYF